MMGRRLLLLSAAERSLLGQLQCTNSRPAQGVTKTGRKCAQMHVDAIRLNSLDYGAMLLPFHRAQAPQQLTEQAGKRRPVRLQVESPPWLVTCAFKGST
jgi:hypothetical protein